MAKKDATIAKGQYTVRIGLDYAGRRYEPGDDAEGLPEKSAGWLLEDKAIEPVKEENDGV